MRVTTYDFSAKNWWPCIRFGPRVQRLLPNSTLRASASNMTSACAQLAEGQVHVVKCLKAGNCPNATKTQTCKLLRTAKGCGSCTQTCWGIMIPGPHPPVGQLFAFVKLLYSSTEMMCRQWFDITIPPNPQTFASDSISTVWIVLKAN